MIALGELVHSDGWLVCRGHHSQTVSASDANELAKFYLLKPPVGWLQRLFLREALTSGLFLEYDQQAHIPRSGPLQSALLELQTRIDNDERAVEPMAETTMREVLAVMRYARGGWGVLLTYHVDDCQVVPPHQTCRTRGNTLARNRSLYLHFSGDHNALVTPELRPTLPNPQDAVAIDREWVSQLGGDPLA